MESPGSPLLLVTCLTAAVMMVQTEAFDARLHYITDERPTSDVNLERYYIIEEDIMSNVEALIRDDTFDAADGEAEEEHQKHKPNLGPIASAINRTKLIHMEAGRDISSYLSHPVNVFHLLRRLDDQWRKCLDIVLGTKLCREWKIPGMVRHLRYVRDRLPGGEALNNVVQFLAYQLRLFGPQGQEVTSGRVGDQLAVQPLDVRDQFIIAKSLYDQENYQSSLPWLTLVNTWLSSADPADRAEMNFTLTSVLKMMSAAYYEVNNPSAAMTLTERLLKEEPSNKLLQTNLAFFKRKAEKQKEEDQVPSRSAVAFSKYERLCTQHLAKWKPTHHRCVLEPVIPQPVSSYHFYKKEILRETPPIYLLHDVITPKTADDLKDYSFNTMSDRSWTSDHFRLPHFRLVFNYPHIHPLETRNKARRTVNYVRSLNRPQASLLKAWGPLQIFTTGLEGMHMTEHTNKLDLFLQKGEKDVGAYFLFLSEAKQGGRIVMSRRNIVVQPSKGSALFYHTTKSTPHSFCPALGGSVWVAVQPFYNIDALQCPKSRQWY